MTNPIQQPVLRKEQIMAVYDEGSQQMGASMMMAERQKRPTLGRSSSTTVDPLLTRSLMQHFGLPPNHGSMYFQASAPSSATNLLLNLMFSSI